MILAIDTATKWAGLALYDGKVLLAEHGWHSVHTQTVELAPAVAQTLRRADVTAEDLTGIAVALGPGSYTGLRIGLGLAKGMALANQIPLIGVPTLDIVAAAQPKLEAQLVVVAEAGRTRITAGCYEWQGRKRWQSGDRPLNTTWEELLKRLEPPVVFAGEITPEARKLIRGAGRGFHPLRPVDRVRRAGYLATIGWDRLRRGDVDDTASLTPMYLREP